MKKMAFFKTFQRSGVGFLEIPAQPLLIVLFF
jgi:hypothetical protein